jgi:hypothetical protein
MPILPSDTHPSFLRYPPPLRARIVQADHLARALGFLSGKASKKDLTFLWLLGRADEVRTLVDEIVREWTAGSIDTEYACEAIGSYVGALHVALHRRYGGYGASCCGPHLEPFERPSVRSAGQRAIRPPLESGVQVIGSRASSAPDETRKQAVSARRKSAG